MCFAGWRTVKRVFNCFVGKLAVDNHRFEQMSQTAALDVDCMAKPNCRSQAFPINQCAEPYGLIETTATPLAASDSA